MIRVLHILGGMDRGGIETFIMNIYRNIDRNKIQFDFLLSTQKECAYNNEIRNLGGKIFYVPPRKSGILKNRKALNDFFKKHREYKIVHQHVSSLTNVEPLKIAKKYHIPIRIIHSHNTNQGGSHIHKYIHKYNQLFVESFATHYFACSNLAAKWLYPPKQYKEKNFKIINNGIDVDKFIYNNEIRDTYRKKLGIENKFVIGHVGRFHPQKNHEFLIEIFRAVVNRNKNSLLLLVGDGSLRQYIEEKVNRLKLTDNVMFAGVRSDIPELLQAMDVFVMPSYHEGLPVTLVEAQSACLPCVLSKNITDEIEILDNIKWCDLSDDLSIWVDNILYFMKNTIRRNTKKEIIDAGFDINNVAHELQQIYIQSIN